jgi:hypothetical protein
VDRQLQHTFRKREKKELLLKEKLLAIRIAKTTRSLIRVKVGNNSQVTWVNGVISNGASSVLEKIKKSDRVDLLFLIIFPSPVWPLYFAYRGKIKGFLKRDTGLMKNSEKIRRKIFAEYIWIKRVIESAETPDHIKCCKKIIENWSNATSFKINGYKCAFYKTKDFKKTIESYRRSHSDLSKDVAEKSVFIIHPINIG